MHAAKEEPSPKRAHYIMIGRVPLFYPPARQRRMRNLFGKKKTDPSTTSASIKTIGIDTLKNRTRGETSLNKIVCLK